MEGDRGALVEHSPLVVRFQDSSVLVLDKPAGMHTAPLRSGETGTLLEMVLGSFPEVAGLPGVKPEEPGLVHRIDRETSGLVVVARTVEAFAALRGQFTSGGARKRYLAACARLDEDVEKGGSFRVASRFAPYGPGGRRVRVVLAQERPGRLLRQATRDIYATEAAVEARAAGRVLLSVWITRGFRHQVRVHLSCRGYPILGDPLYGAAVPDGFLQRMYLHAARIDLVHPVSGAALVVESPTPPEFLALFPKENRAKGATA